MPRLFLQVVIPILQTGKELRAGNALLPKYICHALCGHPTGLVIVQAKERHLRFSDPLQHSLHRLEGGPAAGDIAVFLPPLRVQGNMGQKVDGRFKHEEVSVAAQVVKRIPRIAALHIDSEGIPEAVRAALISLYLTVSAIKSL